MKAALPLVYACSGCTGAGQLANRVALMLQQYGAAEMASIAGVGGDVPALVAQAKSARPVIAIDGCALGCARRCLKRHGIVPARSYRLSDFGVRDLGMRKPPGRNPDAGYSLRDAEDAFSYIAAELILEKLAARAKVT
ncbi:MAG TPA: putative zinc-binding protein [Burkholderiales bacterium]|nr:putative zinc-binding protein [Burkholderiales bacterium]